MFKDILEFLEPVLNVFTAIVIFSLGITICVGCIMLAFKTCGRFNAFVRKKAEKTVNKWARHADYVVVRIGERIGHFVKEAIEKSKTGIPVDMRPKMVGDWFCPDGADMTISEHNGYCIIARASTNRMILFWFDCSRRLRYVIMHLSEARYSSEHIFFYQSQVVIELVAHFSWT